MILVDSSVWIDHFRQTNQSLLALLSQEMVLLHPFVIGEIAVGSIRDRSIVIAELLALPVAVVASDDEVLHLIESARLHSQGISYVDAHLLASIRLTDDTKLWTFDRRLNALAKRDNVAAYLPPRLAH